ncbi:MAG: HelD family protein [Chitinispirillaceae bacterium]
MSQMISKEEKHYFETVLSKLKASLQETNKRIHSASEGLEHNKQYLWDNIHDMDGPEKSQIRQTIAIAGLTGESLVGKRDRLERLVDSPYFGRIDFSEKGTNAPKAIYIGVHPFHDESSGKSFVYDWRAPISSMFYDYELGDAHYQAPTGDISGKISLKRQFRIRKSRMEFMLESSVAIQDDILQKELSSTSDERMKTIVATIQKDQNRIIRNDSSRVLIIQGVAGSGKTSIALHRVAFLLYKYRDTIASKDIMIISPNSVFADYISNVLPELGEETIPEIDFDTIAVSELGGKVRFQTFFDQVSTLLHDPDKRYIERIRYKSSLAFLEKLRAFVSFVEENYFVAGEIRAGGQVIAADFVAQRYRAHQGLPIKTRLTNAAKDIARLIKMSPHFERGYHKASGIHSAVKKMFRTTSLTRLYREFYDWCGEPSAFKKGKGGVLEFSDVFPLVYLKLKLEGSADCSYRSAKHLVVDEMQDYTPVQYAVVSELFRCKKTILGDANQSVNPYSSSTFEEIRKVFSDADCFKLNKSYRSSYEITSFAQKIQRNEELEPVERHGEEPVVKVVNSESEQIEQILSVLEKAEHHSHSSIGIVCKTQLMAEELFNELRPHLPSICLLTPDSTTFQKGIVITTAHMSKGLEFDQVIVPSACSHNYSTEIDRSMLYIACTRALHSLRVFAVKELTSFIQK